MVRTVLLLLALQAAQAHAAGAGQPNIILVVLDAARADHVSSYGYGKPTTPELDAIGREGAVFLRAFSQAADTRASLPLILSSRYLSLPMFGFHERGPWSARVENPRDVFLTFDRRQAFLPRVLSEHGYRTFLCSGHPELSQRSRVADLFEEVRWKRVREGDPFPEAADWIRRHKDARFFLYLHVMAPHFPYEDGQVEPSFLEGLDRKEVEAVRGLYRTMPFVRPGGAWDAGKLEVLRALYDARLRRADQGIGTLRETLKSLGLEGRTALIVTADHGENLGEHGRVAHGGAPFDSVTHVPLLISYPPRVPAGTRVSGLVASVDIFPTILDLAGIAPPQGSLLAGQSLLPGVAAPETGRGVILAERFLRTRTHKFIEPDILFDLSSDPGETVDIAGRRPELLERLRKEHELLIAPHRRLFLESKAGPPERAFYYEVAACAVEPAGFVETTSSFLAEMKEGGAPRSTRPWLLNTHETESSLLPNPFSRAGSTITLSCVLPDGAYRVSAQFEVPGGKPVAFHRFRFRLDPAKPFSGPERVERVPDAPGDSVYLQLGSVKVAGRRLRLELAPFPSGGEAARFKSIGFLPAAAARAAGRAVSEAESESARESLRRLGYLE
ncbi:MAG: sulfatase [Elusimicrobia bacterium]|nr:sulfatase [Elusimicrobiota bacterium]